MFLTRSETSVCLQHMRPVPHHPSRLLVYGLGLKSQLMGRKRD
jgi:hypothetical protein